MSAPSQKQIIPVWRHLNTAVSDSALYTYLVRLAILNYRLQPRFKRPAGGEGGTGGQSRALTSPGGDALSPTQSASAALLGSSNGTAHLPSSLGNLKLPKDTAKLLEAKFKAMALNKGKDRQEDPLLRRSFLAFYAVLLNPTTMKRIKEDRRAEDLLMMFLSCAARELAKSGLVGTELTSGINTTAAAFVRLLVNILKESGGSSSSIVSLIRQLESYEASLKSQREALQPAINKENASIPRSPAAIPTFDINDMFLAVWIAKLLMMPNSEIQKDIDDNKHRASEGLAAAELRLVEKELRDFDRHPVMQMVDFTSKGDFTEWKERELISLAHYITTLGEDNLGMGTSATSLYYIPPEPKSYYRQLLKRCIETDLRNQESDVILSKSSHELLQRAAGLWRVPSTTRAALLLDIAAEMFEAEKFNGDDVEDAFNLCKHMATDQNKRDWDPLRWPDSDKEQVATTLQRFQTAIMGRINQSLDELFNDPPPKIGPLLSLYEEYITNGRDFFTMIDLTPDERQLERLELTIISAAERKYDALIDDIPRDHSLDPLHVVDLADKIIGIAKRLQKRYKFPLFDKIYISNISAERHFTLFAADSHSMVNHMAAHWRAKKEEAPFDDIVLLYKKTNEIRDLHAQVSKPAFGFDIEECFYPYIQQWADTSAQLAQTWVQPTIDADIFQAIDTVTNPYSSSVNDVFQSFGQALDVVKSLHWRNEVHTAKFYTSLMRGISEAICNYSHIILQQFAAELSDEDAKETEKKKTPHTRQDKWLAMARNAVGTTPTKQIVPFRFMPETCIKLNDMEKGQIELDKIEAELQSEQLADILTKNERVSKKRVSSNIHPSSYLFSVRIVQAEGLKACDMNGLSDPYVTLVDQQNRKQIAKTRTIYEDLNPHWDELFEIATSGAKWLTATVWDENALTNHDLCGRAFIRLDPNAFKNHIAQDFWLDLDTQGRILVNISMESEKDDIRFYFGKAYRTLIRSENEMIRMIVDKFTAYINYSISPATLKSLLGSKKFSMDTVSSWLSSTRLSGGGISVGSSAANGKAGLTQVEIEDSLIPLFDYLNENFATLANVLTRELRIKVMTRTWKVVLKTIDGLLLPALSDRRALTGPNAQLTNTEAEIVFIWLSTLRDFFYHDGEGPPLEELQSQRYQELMAIPVYYDLSTAELKAESEKLSSLSFKTMQERNYFAVSELIKRRNTVMAHSNKKVLRRQNEQLRNAKRESPQTEDIILRILRARGEQDYVSRRLKQRERIAQTLATESIVKNAANSGFCR